MDTYKLKFTRLQNEILRFLFIKSGQSFNQRALARALKVSPTAISKALEELEEDGLVNIDKDTNHLSIELNTRNPDIFWMKRAENLKLLHESGLVEYLSEQFPGSTPHYWSACIALPSGGDAPSHHRLWHSSVHSASSPTDGFLFNLPNRDRYFEFSLTHRAL